MSSRDSHSQRDSGKGETGRPSSQPRAVSPAELPGSWMGAGVSGPDAEETCVQGADCRLGGQPRAELAEGIQGQVLLPVRTFSLLTTAVCRPGATARTNDHRRRLKHQEVIASGFWRPEVQNQGVDRARLPPEAPWEGLPASFSLWGLRASQGLRLRPSASASVSVLPSRLLLRPPPVCPLIRTPDIR